MESFSEVKTLYLEINVQGHQPWYAKYRLEVIYPHAKYKNSTPK